MLEEAAEKGVAAEATFLNLGRVLAQSGRLEKSIESLHQALSLNPQSEETLLTLAMVHSLKDERALARQFLQQLLKLNPDHEQAGFLLERLGN